MYVHLVIILENIAYFSLSSGCYAAGVLPLVVAVGAIGLMFVQVMIDDNDDDDDDDDDDDNDYVCAVSAADQAQGPPA